MNLVARAFFALATGINVFGYAAVAFAAQKMIHGTAKNRAVIAENSDAQRRIHHRRIPISVGCWKIVLDERIINRQQHPFELRDILVLPARVRVTQDFRGIAKGVARPARQQFCVIVLEIPERSRPGVENFNRLLRVKLVAGDHPLERLAVGGIGALRQFPVANARPAVCPTDDVRNRLGLEIHRRIWLTTQIVPRGFPWFLARRNFLLHEFQLLPRL